MRLPDAHRLVLGAAVCLGLSLAGSDAGGDPRRPSSEGPLVLELFTSQGCSSCPAADRLLSRLAAAGTLGDRAIAPLAFHVDYWNDLGWADPYSSPAWTERQQQYARAIGDDRVYTPELVIGGAAGVLGSSLGAVSQAVQRAARPARLAVSASWTGDALMVSATAPDDAEVWVAIWQDGTSTTVARGENAGATLRGDRVVRQLVRVATTGERGARAIQLPSSWRAAGAVAFAQRADRRIVASAWLPR